MKLPPIIRTLRPHQWHKNAAVFAALVFDVKFFEPVYVGRTLIAFVFLALISSAVYLVNDLADIEQDKIHPTKRFRPIPAGEVSKVVAQAMAIAFPVIIIPLAFMFNTWFGIIITLYYVQNLAYSFVLKHVVLIDVMLIAAGFVLRVAAGVVLIDVERFSPWLYICVTLGALFIGFGKRRHELVLAQQGTGKTRAVLEDYSLEFIDWLIAIVATSTLVSYSIYTFSAPNVPDNHTMMLTIPFVFYGIARYMYLIHVKGEGGAPDELVLRDRPLFITVAIWGLVCATILFISQ